MGPFGTLSIPGVVSDGPTGQVKITSVVGHRDQLSPVGSCLLGSRRFEEVRLIPGICADPTACKYPIIPDLPADGPAGDVAHAVDMNVMRDSYPDVPAIGDCRAVVAMVGLEVAQRKEETPREYGGDCAVFATSLRPSTAYQCTMVVICVIQMIQNGMTLNWDLAYREHVERYNFDALDGMELKFFERLKAVNEPTMMVSEIPGRGLARQELHAPQADKLDSVGIRGLLTEGNDVGEIAESPIHRSSVMPHEGMTTLYYEGDLGDLDCGSVEDRERDTWDDWCDFLSFRNGYGGAFPDDVGVYPPVVFSDPLLWENDMAESSHVLPDDGQAPVSTSPILADRRLRGGPFDTQGGGFVNVRKKLSGFHLLKN